MRSPVATATHEPADHEWYGAGYELAERLGDRQTEISYDGDRSVEIVGL